MRKTDRIQLLGGPYRQPALRVGDRAACLYRDRDVLITSWTDAPISWPRCRPVEVKRSHPTLLVDGEPARAIRTESAAALMHWWGVGVKLVWKWRKAFAISRAGTPGSARLVQAAAQFGAEAMQTKKWTEEEREQKRQLAIDGNYAAFASPGYNSGPWWSDEELALLGTAPNAEVAGRIERTVEVVRRKRIRLGIATADDRRREG